MTRYAITAPDGRVLRVVAQDEAPAESHEVIEPWVGYPPCTGTELAAESGALYWREGRTLDGTKIARVESMRDQRDARVFGALSWDGSAFDADARSQSVIEAMYTDARLDPNDPDEPFRLADNSWRVLTRADKIALGKAMRVHVRSAFAQFAQREAAVNAATTIPDVIAVP